MQKLWIYFLLIGIVFSCKKETQPEVADANLSEFTAFQNTPKTQDINAEAMIILKDWAEFTSFQKSFDFMYRAGNNEDLVLAIDDLLEKENNLRESKYPEEFDKTQIRSRQKVLRTFLLKVKASLVENTDVNEPVKQMLTARNAFRYQFNIIVSNKLDTKLILDEN